MIKAVGTVVVNPLSCTLTKTAFILLMLSASQESTNAYWKLATTKVRSAIVNPIILRPCLLDGLSRGMVIGKYLLYAMYTVVNNYLLYVMYA